MMKSMMFLLAGVLLTLSFIDPADWTTLKEQDGVVFQVKKMKNRLSNNVVREVLVYKVINNNSYDVTVGWKSEKYYDGQCTNCEGANSEHMNSVKISSMSSVQGDPSTKRDGLSVFYQFENGNPSKSKLTDLIVKDVTVQK